MPPALRFPNLGAESFLLSIDYSLEGRPAVHLRDVGHQLRPSLRIDAITRELQIHELRRDADIGDAELVPDQPLLVADFTFEVVEHRREFLVDGLLNRR